MQRPARRRIASVLLDIHLYTGLLCSGYLVIFALSALSFNHPLEVTAQGKETHRWERFLAVPATTEDRAASEAVRDALGLQGWTIPWETRRDARGDLEFGLARPGKHYRIQVLASEQKVRVEETRHGAWDVIRALHGLGGVPGSRLAKTWGIYTEVCVLAVLFSLGSGVYLWWRRRSERRVGAGLMGALTGGSLLFMVALRLWG